MSPGKITYQHVRDVPKEDEHRNCDNDFLLVGLKLVLRHNKS
jgi:hypothetical protein